MAQTEIKGAPFVSFLNLKEVQMEKKEKGKAEDNYRAAALCSFCLFVLFICLPDFFLGGAPGENTRIHYLIKWLLFSREVRLRLPLFPSSLPIIA